MCFLFIYEDVFSIVDHPVGHIHITKLYERNPNQKTKNEPKVVPNQKNKSDLGYGVKPNKSL